MTSAILTDDTKLEILRLKNDNLSIRAIAHALDISKTTVGNFLSKETYADWWAKHEKPIASGSLHDHYHQIKKLPGNRFILTSAQNSTYVHSKFLASLETMAKSVGATILVGTFSYNVDGFQNLQKSEGEWFDSKIKKYIVDEPIQLAEDLIWCGELNVIPTAVNPLSGFHSYTKNCSGIIPHAKVQLESLPTAKDEPVRILYTTGAVTQRNYIQKKSGQKASFHHIFGALIVEIDDDGDWFVRQLIADTETGEFYDLDRLYTPTGVSVAHRVEAINWGDIHAEKADFKVYAASFGNKGSMIDALMPKYQLVHDVLDMQARNHHTINDPYVKFALYVQNKDWVSEDVARVANVLDLMHRDYCKTVIVESNHDLALQRWLKTADYKTDPANALFFLDCQLATYNAIADGDSEFSVFKYALTKHNSALNRVKFLRTDESFMICGKDGIECGAHGHLGNNGARGSINAYQKLGTRYNIGHSHSANIRDGVYQAGVSAKMDMGYNQGGSSWSHSHIVTYANSKRTIVTLKNGKWKA
jgi:hypothetical protein